MSLPLPKEKVISRIESLFENSKYSFVSFVEPYINSRSKVIMNCAEHGEWSVAIRHLTTSASGCPKCGSERCSRKKADSLSVVLHKICHAAERNGNKFIRFSNVYKNRKSKIIIECGKHGEYETNINNFVDNGKGCPGCKRTGFNPSKPGYLYALRSKCGQFVKIGITNNPDSRIRTLVSHTPFEFQRIEIIRFEDGSNAESMEKIFHKHFKSAGLRGFDGCTEWLSWSSEIQGWFRFLC